MMDLYFKNFEIGVYRFLNSNSSIVSIIYLFIYLSIYSSIYLFIHLYLFIH